MTSVSIQSLNAVFHDFPRRTVLSIFSFAQMIIFGVLFSKEILFDWFCFVFKIFRPWVRSHCVAIRIDVWSREWKIQFNWAKFVSVNFSENKKMIFFAFLDRMYLDELELNFLRYTDVLSSFSQSFFSSCYRSIHLFINWNFQ